MYCRGECHFIAFNEKDLSRNIYPPTKEMIFIGDKKEQLVLDFTTIDRLKVDETPDMSSSKLKAVFNSIKQSQHEYFAQCISDESTAKTFIRDFWFN